MLVDLTGRRFGKLVVLYKVDPPNGNHKHGYWMCLCDCGNYHITRTDYLTRGYTTSCGCYRMEMLAETLNTKQGMVDNKFKKMSENSEYKLPGTLHHSNKNSPYYRFYRIFVGMRYRCNNPKSTNYKYYGGKGIKVLWDSYEEFFFDMYQSYIVHVKFHGEKNTTIDRIDPTKDYCKENCRWATYKVQANNKTNSNKPKKKKKGRGYSTTKM